MFYFQTVMLLLPSANNIIITKHTHLIAFVEKKTKNFTLILNVNREFN